MVNGDPAPLRGLDVRVSCCRFGPDGRIDRAGVGGRQCRQGRQGSRRKREMLADSAACAV